MSRRLVNVFVSPEVVANLFFASRPGEWVRVDRGLPVGARLLASAYDMESDQFMMRFEHPSFAEVPAGEVVPAFNAISMSSINVNQCDKKLLDTLRTLTKEQREREKGCGYMKTIFVNIPIVSDGDSPKIITFAEAIEEMKNHSIGTDAPIIIENK